MFSESGTHEALSIHTSDLPCMCPQRITKRLVPNAKNLASNLLEERGAVALALENSPANVHGPLHATHAYIIIRMYVYKNQESRFDDFGGTATVNQSLVSTKLHV
jgi:hypothetical protein